MTRHKNPKHYPKHKHHRWVTISDDTHPVGENMLKRTHVKKCEECGLTRVCKIRTKEVR